MEWFRQRSTTGARRGVELLKSLMDRVTDKVEFCGWVIKASISFGGNATRIILSGTQMMDAERHGFLADMLVELLAGKSVVSGPLASSSHFSSNYCTQVFYESPAAPESLDTSSIRVRCNEKTISLQLN